MGIFDDVVNFFAQGSSSGNPDYDYENKTIREVAQDESQKKKEEQPRESMTKPRGEGTGIYPERKELGSQDWRQHAAQNQYDSGNFQQVSDLLKYAQSAPEYNEGRTVPSAAYTKDPETGEWGYTETPSLTTPHPGRTNDTWSGIKNRVERDARAEQIKNEQEILDQYGQGGLGSEEYAGASHLPEMLSNTKLTYGNEDAYANSQDAAEAIRKYREKSGPYYQGQEEDMLTDLYTSILENSYGIDPAEAQKIISSGALDNIKSYDENGFENLLGLSDFDQFAPAVNETYQNVFSSIDAGNMSEEEGASIVLNQAASETATTGESSLESWLSQYAKEADPEKWAKMKAATATDCWEWWQSWRIEAATDDQGEVPAYENPLDFQLYGTPDEWFEYCQFCHDAFHIYNNLCDETGTINREKFEDWYWTNKELYNIIATFFPEEEAADLYLQYADIFAFDLKSAKNVINYFQQYGTTLGNKTPWNDMDLYTIALGERTLQGTRPMGITPEEAQAIYSTQGADVTPDVQIGPYQEGGEYSARDRALKDYWQAYDDALAAGGSEEDAWNAAHNWLYDNGNYFKLVDDTGNTPETTQKVLDTMMLDSRLGFNKGRQ